MLTTLRMRRISLSSVLLGSGLTLLAGSALAATRFSSANISLLALAGLLLATTGVLESGNLSRVQRAFALSPLVPCFVVGVLSDTPLVGLVVAPFAYVFSVLLGGPAFLLMRRLRWLGIWQVVGVSALLGAVAGAVLSAPNLQTGEVGVFAGYGAATGLAFWVIALGSWPRALSHSGREREV